MLCELIEIERACSYPLGSLKQVALINPNDLYSQPKWYDIPNVADLDWKPGKSAYSFPCDRQNARLTDKPVISARAGDVVEYNLSCTVRGIRLQVDWLRRRLINRRIHVVATYQDGYQKFVPWMRLLGESDSGERRNSRNQYSFTGQARLLNLAPAIAASLTPGGGGGGGGETDPPPVAGIEPVVITTSASTATYLLPAGKTLLFYYISSNADQVVDLGITASGDEINDGIEVAAGTWHLSGAPLWYAGTATTLYFSGLAGTNTIKLYIL